MKEDRPTAALVLGAGFSRLAGVPLASELLAWDALAFSKGAEQRFAQVRAAWHSWQTDNPDAGTEQFLADLYERNQALTPLPWSWAVELIGAILATPRGADLKYRLAQNLRYAVQIAARLRCPVYEDFWDTLVALVRVGGVVTTNYDIVAERLLRHRPMPRKGRPGFFYAGLDGPQWLRGRANPFLYKRPGSRLIEAVGSVPLAKLHGSLNWTREEGELRLYQDLRPAFRHGGNALIIPPMERKENPEWIEPVWNASESILASAEIWIICGYSFPPYDRAVLELFRRSSGSVDRIFVLDPDPQAPIERLRRLAPAREIHDLPGLPEGTEALGGFLGRRAPVT